MDAKELIRQTLDFWRYKLDHDLCTMEELESLSKMLQNNLKVTGTITDFANFYKTSEGNVRVTINRKLIDKPTRKVLYPFFKFIKIIPEKWIRKKD